MFNDRPCPTRRERKETQLRLKTRRLTWRRKLLFESLETRRVLANVVWDGGGDATSWNDPLNWSVNALPTKGDSVSIPELAGTSLVTSTGQVAVANLSTSETLQLASGSVSIQGPIDLGASLDLDASSVLHTGGPVVSSQPIQIDAGATFAVNNIPTDGLVGLWHAEGDGTDAVGNNHGTLTNGASVGDGKIGQGFVLDGINDRVSLSNPTGLPFGNTPRTVMAWINPSNLTVGGTILHYGDGVSASGPSPGSEFVLQIAKAGGTTYLFTDNADVTGGTNITIAGNQIPTVGQWSHIAFSYDGGTGWQYYLNGALAKSGTFATPLNTVTPTVMNIGGATPDPAWAHFPGQIDEVAIHSRVLSQAEIQAAMSGGAFTLTGANTTTVSGTLSAGSTTIQNGTLVVGNTTSVPNAVSYLRADGTASDNINGNHGSLQNGATFADGKFGQAFSFDGANDYVHIPDSENLELTTALTLSAWINPTDVSNYRQIISKFGSAGNYAYEIGLAPDGRLRVDISGDGSAYDLLVSPSGAIQPDVWTHVATTFNSGTWQLFLNGKEVASKSSVIVSIFTGGNTSPAIGRNSEFGGVQHFSGLIDEPAIYGRALAADEVATLARAKTYQVNGTSILAVTGEILGEVLVEGSGTLTGIGTVSGNVFNAGVVAPGTSPGNLTINGNYSQAISGDLNIEVGGPVAGTEYDQLAVNGSVTLSGDLNLSLINGYVPTAGHVFRIIDNDGTDAISGTFTGLPEGATITLGVNTFKVSYAGGTGNDVVLTASRAVTWDGGSSPVNFNWNDPLNWSIDAVPAPGDDVVIPDLAGTPAITSTGSVAIRNLTSAEKLVVSSGSVSVLNAAKLNGGLEETGGVFFSGSPFSNASDVTLGSGSTLAVSGSTSGLVGLWHGEGNALDAAGGNNATLLNGATFASGKVGQAFSFDGVDDHVRISPSGSLAISGDMSFSLWFQRNSTSVPATSEYILSQGSATFGGVDGPSSYVAYLEQGTGKVAVGFEGASGQDELLKSTATILDTNFHQLGYVRQGTVHRLYLDGIQVAQATYTVAPGNASAIPFLIGGLTNENTVFQFFKGQVDEVAVYNRALTAAEIVGGTYAQTAGITTVAGVLAASTTDIQGGSLNVGNITAIQDAAGLWRGDGNTSDSVGTGTGTLTNGTTFTSGTIGQAFRLDGTDDYVSIPDSASFTSNAITLSAWVRPDNLSGNRSFLTKYDTVDSTQGLSWYFGAVNGRLHFYVYQTNSSSVIRAFETNLSVLTVGVWQHVAASFDPSSQLIRLYVNSVEMPATLVAGSSTVTSIFDSATPIRIGAARASSLGGFGWYYAGAIDEPAVFSRALTSTEITALATARNHTVSGTTIVANSAEIASAVTVTSTGTLSGTGLISGNIANAGFVAPGTSPGTLTINGNYSQTNVGTVFGVKSYGDNVVTSSAPAELFSFKADGNSFVDLGPVRLSGVNIDVDGLALSPTLGLLGFQIESTGSTLLSINQSNATATTIGSRINGREIRGAAFDAANNLWVIDETANELLQVDPATGVIVGTPLPLTLNGSLFNVEEGTDIAVRSDGTLSMVHSTNSSASTYSLSTSTGALNFVFSDAISQTTTEEPVNPLVPYHVGLAFGVSDSWLAMDVIGREDIYRYDPNNFARTQLLANLVPSFNSGRGDLATNVNTTPDGALEIEIGGTSVSGQYDQLVVNGTVTLGGALNVSLINGFVPSGGNVYRIIDNDGTDAVAGSFAGFPEGATFTVGGTLLSISYTGGTGNDVVLIIGGTVTWDGGAGTLNWSDAANWSSDSVPTAADDVVIDIPASNPTITVTGTRYARSLVSNEAITFSGGTFTSPSVQLNAPGTIAGATIVGTNFSGTGSLQITASGTLNGVTLGVNTTLREGTSGSGNQVTVLNDLTLDNGSLLRLERPTVNGGNDDSRDVGLNFGGVQTLAGNGTVELFSAVPTTGVFEEDDTRIRPTGAGVLTIAPGITVRNATNSKFTTVGDIAGGAIVNQGTILAQSSGNTLRVTGTSTTTTGTLQVSNGTLDVNNLIGNVSNTTIATGTLDLDGSYVINVPLSVPSGALTLRGDWDNNSSITQSGGTINLGDVFTVADLGTFTGTNGLVSIFGTLDGTATPSNETLTIDATRQWQLAGGVLKNITVSGGGDVTKPFQITSASGTLDSVTLGWNTTLREGTSGSGNQVTVLNNLTLANSSLLRLERPTVNGGNDDSRDVGLNFAGVQTLAGTGTVELFSAVPTNGVFEEDDTRIRPTGNGTLTIGPGVTVRNATNSKFTTVGDIAGGAIINQGTILAQSSGNTLRVTGTSTTTTGTLQVSNGTLDVNNLIGNVFNTTIATGTLDLDGTYAFNVPVSVPSGALTLRGDWDNNSSITQSGGTINLGDVFTVADLGTFAGTDGLVSIFGTLDGTATPSNETLTIDATRQWQLAGGVLKNITVSGGGDVTKPFQITSASGTLDSVTLGWNTTLREGTGGSGNQVTVLNNLTLANSSLLRLERPTVNGGNDDSRDVGLNFGAVQTLAGNGTVELFSAVPTTGVFEEDDTRIRPTGNGTLTIGPGVTVRNATNSKFTTVGDIAGGAIVNQGTILAQSSGNTLRVTGTSTTTTGTLQVSNGTLDVNNLIGNVSNTTIATGTLDLDGSYVINVPLSVPSGALTLRGDWDNNSSITQSGGTINLGDVFTVADLGTFAGTDGLVSIFGTLDGTATPSNETLTIDATRQWQLAGGTLKNITVTGGGDVTKPFQITSASGTLDSVTLGWNTTIRDGGNSNSVGNQVTVLNNLSLANNSVLRLEKTNNNAANSYDTGLNFAGVQTLGGTGTVELFSAVSANSEENDVRVRPTSGGTLTIGSGITVRNTTSSNLVTLGHAAGGTLINQATIVAQSSGQALRVTGSTVTNQGTFTATAGTLDVNNLSGNVNLATLSGSGTLDLDGTYAIDLPATVIAGTTLTLRGNWDNNSSITQSGGTIHLGSTFSVANLGTFTGTGGLVSIFGTLDGTATPSNEILTIDAMRQWQLAAGILRNVTVNGGGDVTKPFQITSASGTLDNVTLGWNTTIRDGGNSNSVGNQVTVLNNLTLANNSVLRLEKTNNNAANSYDTGLNFAGIQTLGGTGTVDLFSAVGANNEENDVRVRPTGGGTLTIGSGITVRNTTSSNLVTLGHAAGGTLINQGTIVAQSSGQTLRVTGSTVNNAGSVRAENGGTLQITVSPTNYSNGTLTGGTWEAVNGGVLNVTMPSGIVTNEANILVDGAASRFYRGGTLQALSSLISNTTQGELRLRNGAKITTNSPPPSGVIGYWTGDNTSDDFFGTYNALLSGGAAYSAGQTGSAFAFDGVNDQVIIGSDSSLRPTTTLTIDAWIFPTGPGSASSGFGGIIVNKEGEYEVYRGADGTIRWAFANTTPGWVEINTGAVAPLNTWTRVTVRYNNGVTETFINGSSVHTHSGSGAIGDVFTGQNELRIGGRQAISHFFQGRIEDVMLLSTAMSPAEIDNLSFTTSPLTNDGVLEVGAGAELTAKYGFVQNGTLTVGGTLINGTKPAFSGTKPFTQTGGTTTAFGSIAADAITIAAGRLDSTGNAFGSVHVASGAVVSTGTAAGFLSTGDFDLQSGAALEIKIGGSIAGTQYDQVAATGSVTLAGSLNVSLTQVFNVQAGQTFKIIDNDGTDSVVGSFAGLPGGSIINVGGTDFEIGYGLGDGNDVVLTATSGIDGWTGAAGNLRWLDPANWGSGNLPTSVDRATIGDLPGTPTIVVDGTTIVKGVISAEKIQVTAGEFTILDDSTLAGLGVASGIANLRRANVNNVGTTLAPGATLKLGSDQSLGIAPLTASGGTITAEGNPVSLANSVTLGGNVNVIGNHLLTLSGPVTLSTASAEWTVAAGANVAIEGAIDDGGIGRPLTKSGTGTLSLGGTGTFAGGLNVNAGTLFVDGSVTPSVTTVASGATLGGLGTIASPVIALSGSEIAPGNSPGILNTGNFDLQSGATLNAEIGGTVVGTQYDQVNVTGTVTLAGTLNAHLIGGFVPSATQSFTIINNDGFDTVIGSFAGLAEGAIVTISSVDFEITYSGGDGNDVVLTAPPTIVTWDGGGDGVNWSDPLNWDTNTLPTSLNRAIIDLVGSNPTINVAGNYTVHSLITAETINFVSGTFTVSTIARLDAIGTIQGATIIGAQFVGTGSLQITGTGTTLDHVTLGINTTLRQGTSGSGNQVTVLNRLTLANTSLLRLERTSTTSGSNDTLDVGLNFTGASSTLNGNGVVELHSATASGEEDDVRVRATGGGTLTIGAGVTVRNNSTSTFTTLGDAATGSLVIAGAVSSQSSGQTLRVTGTTVTNTGTLESLAGELDVNNLIGNVNSTSITNGDLDLDGTYDFNVPVIVPVGSGSLTLRGNWDNNSSIMQAGGTVFLGDVFTVADLGTFTGTGGLVSIFGTLDGLRTPTNETLMIDSARQWQLDGGTLKDVTVTGGGDISKPFQVTASSGTLNNVTLGWNTTLRQGTTGTGNQVSVLNGLTLANNSLLRLERTSTASGGNDTLDVGLNFTGASTTLNGSGVVELHSATASSEEDDVRVRAIGGGTLTIGAGVTVRNSSTSTFATLGDLATGTLVIAGKVSSQSSGQTLRVTGTTVANTGTLESLAGELDVNNLTGHVNGTSITNGDLDLDGTYDINIPVNVPVGTGSLTLRGNWDNNSSITQTGGTINLGDAFTVADLGTFTGTAGTVSIFGTLDGVGTPTNETLTIDSTRQWQLDGGTLKDVTITGGGDILKPFQVTTNSGTLNNVTLGWNTTLRQGTTGSGNQVGVLNGLTLANNSLLRLERTSTASGGNDTLDVGLNFTGASSTLNGSGVVELHSSTASSEEDDVRVRAIGGGTLTIGAGVTVRNSSTSTFTTLGDLATGALVIAGKVSSQSSGQTLRVTGTTVANTGTLESLAGELDVNNLIGHVNSTSITGGDLDLDGTYDFNAPVNVPVGSGSLTLRGNWDNNSTITQAGGTIFLGDVFTVADLGSCTGTGGLVSIFGTLDGVGAPTNETLTIDSTRQWQLDGGTLKDVIITGGGDALKPFQITSASGTLNNVTLGWNTTLRGGISGSGNQVNVLNGLTLANNSLLRLERTTANTNNAFDVGVNFAGNQSFSGNGIVELFSAVASGNEENDVRVRPTGGGTLTIGSGITVRNATNSFLTTLGDATGGAIVIAGQVSSQSNGQTLRVTGSTVTNSGTLESVTGELDVNNLTGHVNSTSITGGDLDLDGTYDFNAPVNVPVGSGSLTLRGNWDNNSTITQIGGTIHLGDVFTVADLGSFTGTGGLVSIFGTLDGVGTSNNETLTIDSTRQWELAGGTLKDVTITGGGDVLKPFQITSASGTLNNVTLGWNTTLRGGISGSGNQVNVLNGLTLSNNSLLRLERTTANTNNAFDVGLNFAGNQSFSGNGIVELFSALASGNEENDVRVRPTGGGTLTIGSGISVRNAANSFLATLGDATGGAIVIDGIVTSQSNGQTLRVTGSTVTSNGTLLSIAGELETNHLTLNPGSIVTIPAGSSSLTLKGNWDNNGTITQAGGTINLADVFTVADLGTFTGTSGTVNISGTLDGTNTPTNNTLTIDATRQWQLSGGTLKNVIISGGGDVLKPFQVTSSGGTLDNVTLGWHTTLRGGLSGSGNQVTVLNGLTLSNNSVLRLERTTVNTNNIYDVGLNFSGAQTLGGNGIVELFSGLTNSNEENDVRVRSTVGGTLTIGSGITIRNAVNSSLATLGDATGGAFINQGRVVSQSSGQTLRVTGSTVTNTGIFEAVAGTLGLQPTTLTNFVAGTLTAGTWKLSGGVLQFPGADVVTNAATIFLENPNSRFLNATTGVDALKNLQTTSPAGQLSIANSTRLVSLVPYTNSGTTTIDATSTFIANQTPSQDLIGLWHAENNAFDVAGANFGTLANGVTYAAGKVGQAFNFDGVNDLVSTPLILSYATGASLTGWIKTSDSAGTLISGGGGASASRGMGLFITGGALTLYGSKATGGTYNFQISGPIVNDGQYHHVAATWTGTTDVGSAKLYLDGVLVGTATALATITTDSQTTQFGHHSSFNAGAYPAYEGLIDEVAIYSRAISPSEIQSILSSSDIYTQTAGTSIVNGTLVAKEIHIQGGTIGGGGSIVGPIFIEAGGTISPGNSPEIIDVDDFDLGVGGTLLIETGGTVEGTDYDQVNVTGTVTLAGILDIDVYSSFQKGTQFTIINNDGVDPIVGTFAGIPEGSVIDNGYDEYLITYVGGDGNDVVLTALTTVRVVTNTNDFGSGSLRGEMLAANAVANEPAAIIFHIPGSGPHTITPSSSLPFLSDTTYIDASSQPGYSGTPIVELNGFLVNGDGLTFAAGSSDSLVRGLMINRFGQDGIQVISADRNTIVGNYIGNYLSTVVDLGNGGDGIVLYDSVDIIIGGPNESDRNVISGNKDDGIHLDLGTAGTIIEGNYIGLNAGGTNDIGNRNFGVHVSSSGGPVSLQNPHDNYIGVVGGAPNVISGNDQKGVYIPSSASTGNEIVNNIIGLNATGTAVVRNTHQAVHVSASDNIIGVAGGGNTIVGATSEDAAIQIDSSTGNKVQGNRIGTDITGTVTLGSYRGISLSGFGHLVGGKSFGDGNTIRGMFDGGIISTAGNTFLGNSIFNSDDAGEPGTALGIDIGFAGVTTTDMPVIDLAVAGASSTRVGGSINGTADSAYRIEVFVSPTAGTTGYGEGQTYLGFVNVKTDATGFARFNFATSVLVTTGNFVSATATREGVGTSEFALSVAARDSLKVLSANDSGPSTLRQAILDANANAGGDLIEFLLPPIPVTVLLQGGLPTITGRTVIDGTSTPGYTGRPFVEVSANNSFTHVFDFANTAAGSELRGLAVGGGTQFNVVVGADDVLIAGNFIGVNLTGVATNPGFVGVEISTTASRVTVGGKSAMDRNVIAGNNVDIEVAGVDHRIQGNIIGLAFDESQPLSPPLAIGINISGSEAIIGTDGDGDGDEFEGNIIAGYSSGTGIRLDISSLNVIAGNRIGIASDGVTSYANATGISLLSASNQNRIGTDGNGVSDALEGNVISGNQTGIVVDASTNNVIAGNYVGVNPDGTIAIGNSVEGILVNADETTIGGPLLSQRNIISGNGIGLRLAPSTSDNRVFNNFIGLNAAGMSAIPNLSRGVETGLGSTHNFIGTDGDGTDDELEKNVIAGNANFDLHIDGNSNFISGNFIGTDVTGLTKVSGGATVRVEGDNVLVGTNADGVSDAAERNVISGQVEVAGQSNTFAGNFIGIGADSATLLDTVSFQAETGSGHRLGGAVEIERNYIAGLVDVSTAMMIVQGNHIGVFPDGITPTGAGMLRIQGSGSDNNQIGGANIGEGNVISQVTVSDQADLNIFEGNFIGTNAAGTDGLGIDATVFVIEQNASFNFIGTPAAGNVISSSHVAVGPQSEQIAIWVQGAGTNNNVIQNNIIGLDPIGVCIVGNFRGIVITDGASGTQVGGLGPSEGNTISGNGSGTASAGIWLDSSPATVIEGNLIGTDKSGTLALGHGYGVYDLFG